MTIGAATWRDDLDALVFQPVGHAAPCMVHRLAMRRFLGRSPGPEDCLAFFDLHAQAFEAAAQAKIVRRSLSPDASLHLTSRDVLRQLTAAEAAFTVSS